MFGRMKQETLKGSPAKERVCPKSSRSEVERESHSLKYTNSGASSEKPRFLNQKISLNLLGETSFNFYIGIWDSCSNCIIDPFLIVFKTNVFIGERT